MGKSMDAGAHEIPIALKVLLRVYDLRPDLQEAYPEVKASKYERLIGWAAGVSSRKWEDGSYRMLAPWSAWYRENFNEDYKDNQVHGDFKRRWEQASPDRHLTWGTQVPGDAFVEKAQSSGVFGEEKRVLEVGPGYGRLLSSALSKGFPFRSYTGVDISANNVGYLQKKFSSERFEFICADAERVALPRLYDSLISSLTLKHVYPTFEKAFANISKAMVPGSIACFDLIESTPDFDEPMVENDGLTYIRPYTRQEVLEILQKSSFRLVGFDYVTHAEGRTRLLVVARKESDR